MIAMAKDNWVRPEMLKGVRVMNHDPLRSASKRQAMPGPRWSVEELLELTGIVRLGAADEALTSFAKERGRRYAAVLGRAKEIRIIINGGTLRAKPALDERLRALILK